MKHLVRIAMRTMAGAFIALLSINVVWAQSYSHARVVRLSFVEGDVTLQRPDVEGWAQAPVNTPLQEGFKISTGDNSYAEIQFENGGTIRLGELALLDFTQLGLTPRGGEINHVEFRQGYATFHSLASRLGDSLQVGTPFGTLNPQGDTLFRADLDQGLERLEVFQGAVQVQGNLGAMTIEKDSVLVLQPGPSEPTVVSQGITKDDWDQWVEGRENGMDLSTSGPSPDDYTGDAPETNYGWTDLLQYGNWSDVPGAGYGWVPTGVANGWAPYSSGQWCWYPGFGYTWIGAEPWGWLPYHYGAWDFIPGKGWVWFPGSLRTWSPSQVAWYHGPSWVGWIPRSHLKDATACGNNCGGGVVSTSTFSHGGLLTSNLMLGFSPTTGERVREPGIIPTTAAKLTGPVVSFPAAERQGVASSSGHPQVAPGKAATGTSLPGGRQAAATPPNSTIVYDPQQDRYVNSRRVTPTQESPTSPAGTSAGTTPAAKPGLIPPVPVSGREPSEHAPENPAGFQPSSSGSHFTRSGPSGPNGDHSASRAGASQTGVSHVGGGAPAAVHPAPAPAGGSKSAGGRH